MEWPTRKGSRLAVIGIANTMDLPERFLPRIARWAGPAAQRLSRSTDSSLDCSCFAPAGYHCLIRL